MNKSLKLFFLFFYVGCFGRPDSNFDRFNKAIQDGKYDYAKNIIEKWSENREKDPQYYICVFNYHVNKSRTEGIQLQKNVPNDEKYLSAHNQKTGKVEFYIGSSVRYKKEEIDIGIKAIKRGIKVFPNHFEMRWGLAYAYKEMFLFDKYFNEIEKALSYLKKNKKATIYWNNNEVIKNPKSFFIELLQGNFHKYAQMPCYKRHKTFLNRYTKLQIKYFPDHKYGYNSLGTLFYSKGDYKRAIKYFIKAFSKDQKDIFVAYNIAYLSLKTNNKSRAKNYFEKAVKIGGHDKIVALSKKHLKNIKTKK